MGKTEMAEGIQAIGDIKARLSKAEAIIASLKKLDLGIMIPNQRYTGFTPEEWRAFGKAIDEIHAF